MKYIEDGIVLQDIANELRMYLNEHNIYPDWHIANNDTVAIDIIWGDWKHEHLRTDWLVNEWCSMNGIKITHKNTIETETNGSDCYSATHYYRFAKV